MGRKPILIICDIVESHNCSSIPDGSKGIVIEETWFTRLEIGEEEHYGVYWFYSGRVYQCPIQMLRHCEGEKRKKLCKECEYNDLCPHLKEIVRCDISEFSKWLDEKVIRDIDVCKQRNCAYLMACWTERFIQPYEYQDD